MYKNAKRSNFFTVIEPRWSKLKHHISILFVSGAIESGDQGEQDVNLKYAIRKGPDGDLNPGPPPPKGGIIPLDHRGAVEKC